jgi:hydroxymethylpyrimidine pyrophosphatase-like HAD family hydrolase
VGDLAAFLRQEGGDPTKLSTVLGNEERTARTVAMLHAHFGERIYAVKSHPRFAETVNPHCDKGVALAMLADHLGIAQEQTLAIGDGSNDLALLRWAGIGVAMGQAHPEVHAHADYVTRTLAEDGVAAALERFVLAPAG